MAKTCPDVGKSQVQAVFTMLEDVSGTLQPPALDGYILPAGRASMNQTPSYTDSEELSPSLNTLNQFQNAVPAGTGSIPMYVRLNADYSKPQGDALFVSLMGDYNDPALITAAVVALTGLDETATEITVGTVVNGNVINDNVLAGKLPPLGVVKIADEHILYSGLTDNQDGTYTLTGCKRGYGGTTAAAIADAAVVQMLSRTYTQNTCRPTVSVWIADDDKLVRFMSGCGITQEAVRLQREAGQMLTFDFQGRQMGWCGCGEVAEAPVGVVVKLTEGGADAYTVGGYIRNKTRQDDNSGKGFRIVGVDDFADTITLDTAPVDWEAGDEIYPWMPTADPIGTAVESRFARVDVGGIVGKMNDGTLTVATPITNIEEIGDEFPGEGIDTKRTITLNRSINFRAKDGVEFGKGYRGYELPVSVHSGKLPALTLIHHMLRVKFNTPELGEGDSALTLTQDGAALGVKGEDALFIVQV